MKDTTERIFLVKRSESSRNLFNILIEHKVKSVLIHVKFIERVMHKKHTFFVLFYVDDFWILPRANTDTYDLFVAQDVF